MSELITVTPRGLYCPLGDFYVDPWKGVEHAVVTHAHSDHARWGSKHYYASSKSRRMLEHRLRDIDLRSFEYGEVFVFGPVRVSLHPAGHILGSAQVRIEHEGEVWVVSGDYKRDADPTCAAFEVVPCDTLVTEATFALPVYRWADDREIAEDIWSWWSTNRSQGRSCVLGCYALGKAQRILAGLREFTDDPVFIHGAMVDMVQCYRDEGVELLPTPKASDASKQDLVGALCLAPPSAIGTSWTKRFSKLQTGFASGWMRIRGVKRRRGYDRGFVLSDHADWPGLLRTVRETGAGRVYATHGRTDVLVRYLREEMRVEAHALETLYGEEET